VAATALELCREPVPAQAGSSEAYVYTPTAPRLPLLDRINQWIVRFEYNRAKQRYAAILAREARDKARDQARAAAEVAKIERVQATVLKREMRTAGRRIVDRLSQLEFAHISGSGKQRRVARIRYAQAAATPSAFYLRVDTARLPRGRGVTSEAMSDPTVLHELSLATGMAVEAFRHYARGFWFIVRREGGIGAIPSLVEYDEVWNLMPKTAASLDVPLGIGANRRFYHADIADMPHLLVAGATGFGKSVFLHNILVTVIQRNSPDRVKLVLIDLKGGAGLGPYQHVPHLLDERRGVDEDVADTASVAPDEVEKPRRKRKHGGNADFVIEPRVYNSREDVLDVSRRLLYIIEGRFQAFARVGARDLPGFNHKTGARMPLILVVIDEIQNVMLDRATKNDAESMLTDIASRSRAAGVHMVISTQRPSADVITGLIKANFPGRVAFTTASRVDSRVILDASDAAELGRKGLLIFQNELQRWRCQAANVSAAFVDDVVAAAIQGKTVSTIEHAVGKVEMVRWAIENGGVFTIDRIYQQFRPRGVTYNDVKSIMAQVMSEEFEIHGAFYRWRKFDTRMVEIDENNEFKGDVTVSEIIRWSIMENGGTISRRAVVDAFAGRLSDRAARPMLKSLDGQTVTVDEHVYHVQRGSRGMLKLVAA